MLAFELTSEEIIWPASNKLYHITLQFWQTPFFESKLVRIDIIDSGTKTLLHAVFQFQSLSLTLTSYNYIKRNN